MGVSAGGCLPGGVSASVDRMTDTCKKTLPCRNYVADRNKGKMGVESYSSILRAIAIATVQLIVGVNTPYMYVSSCCGRLESINFSRPHYSMLSILYYCDALLVVNIQVYRSRKQKKDIFISIFLTICIFDELILYILIF